MRYSARKISWSKRIGWGLLSLILLLSIAAYAYWRSKQVQRQGELVLPGLLANVTSHFDERGVPHIYADNQLDAYRALGYLHAQDRWFQMEMARRLAKGELAEVFGAKLLDTDKLFRTMQIPARARALAASLDHKAPEVQALRAYLAGINHYVDHGTKPVEFDALGLARRHFEIEDVYAVAGYLAYSFSAALRTDPMMTYVRDQLGPDYLRVFDLDGTLAGSPRGKLDPAFSRVAYADLNRLAELSQQAHRLVAMPELEGSNAWVISGKLSASGKPILAGDPHISFANPGVWYEAHLHAPGLYLYGYHQALFPFALLGHNQRFAWSLTMLQNDDMDLIAEQTDSAHPNQVWYRGAWQVLTLQQEMIAVKGQPAYALQNRTGPHGPIISDVLGKQIAQSQHALALSWTFLEGKNDLLKAFYHLNGAAHGMRDDHDAYAARWIASPGLNIIWANAKGEIGWSGAAHLRQRAANQHGHFIIAAADYDAAPVQTLDFDETINPYQRNPESGLLVSANHRPDTASTISWQAYFNYPERAERITQVLKSKAGGWTQADMQQLQLDVYSAHAKQRLQQLLGYVQGKEQLDPDLLKQLQDWDGEYRAESVAASVLQQWQYEIIQACFADKLGEDQFKNLLRTRQLDHALPRLLADANSPWWDRRNTPQQESRADIVTAALQAALLHLKTVAGQASQNWQWAKLHTLTHKHPSAQSSLFSWLNAGPFAVPGNREIVNNLSIQYGPAPWPVLYGPSTRRVIDLAHPEAAVGGTPVGQSGVVFDAHYRDQAQAYAEAKPQAQYLLKSQVQAHTKSSLKFLAKP